MVIAGGGPAGIAVTVLEKHADFLRDFRGDTVHASTVALLDELGLGAEFRELPQSRMTSLLLPGTDSQRVPVNVFAALRAPYNYVAMVPQWDLLNLLAKPATAGPQQYACWHAKCVFPYAHTSLWQRIILCCSNTCGS